MLLRPEGLNFSTAKEALQDLLRGLPLSGLEEEVRECLGAEPNCTLLESPAVLDGAPKVFSLGNVALALEPPNLLRCLASLVSVALPPALGPRLRSGTVANAARGMGWLSGEGMGRWRAWQHTVAHLGRTGTSSASIGSEAASCSTGKASCHFVSKAATLEWRDSSSEACSSCSSTPSGMLAAATFLASFTSCSSASRSSRNCCFSR